MSWRDDDDDVFHTRKRPSACAHVNKNMVAQDGYAGISIVSVYVYSTDDKANQQTEKAFIFS